MYRFLLKLNTVRPFIEFIAKNLEHGISTECLQLYLLKNKNPQDLSGDLCGRSSKTRNEIWTFAKHNATRVKIEKINNFVPG
jgi:hypothetical protein